MRSQHNGLKALSDASLSVTAAQVDAVNTLPAGTPRERQRDSERQHPALHL